MNQAAQVDRSPDAHRGTLILLSLYLLLLAFFVLLNSVARFEDTRARQAIGSVNAEFRALLPFTKTGRTSGTSDGIFRGADAFRRELRKLFEDALPLAVFEPAKGGEALRLEVAAEDLFRPGEVDLRPRSRPLIDKLAAILARDRPGLRVEAELVLGAGASLPSGRDIGTAFSLRRAGSLAHALRRRGVPAEGIRVGLLPGDRDNVSLSFQLRDLAQAKITFEEAVAR
ncbi:MAG: hypothetical protein QF578_02795 [Alphaproteobacteria bacterium]|jgi:hypothetical protein|nr:hypothetical protein [Alphaproteobacteria bacterium]MDP6563729.1 hypothetical protein [Alphaproteobacteria bacterium]MDP6815750.1 hypothetical protein [Alphaproteobacteria bacterium]